MKYEIACYNQAIEKKPLSTLTDFKALVEGDPEFSALCMLYQEVFGNKFLTRYLPPEVALS